MSISAHGTSIMSRTTHNLGRSRTQDAQQTVDIISIKNALFCKSTFYVHADGFCYRKEIIY